MAHSSAFMYGWVFLCREFMFKFIKRFVINFAILIGISIPLELVGGIVLAIYLPIHRYFLDRKPNYTIEDLKLLYIFRWFDNADMYVGRDTSAYEQVAKGSLWDHYCWLAWRNPCNYFGYIYLGNKILVPVGFKREYVKINADDVSSENSTLEIGNTTYDIPGYFYQEFKYNNKTYYEYYYIKKYTLFKLSLCIRFRMGWKIGQDTAPSYKWCQGVFVIHPWMGYWGK